MYSLPHLGEEAGATLKELSPAVKTRLKLNLKSLDWSFPFHNLILTRVPKCSQTCTTQADE